MSIEVTLVDFVLRQLDKFFTRHADLLCNTDQYVEGIKRELESMRSSLFKAKSTKEPWLKDLKEVAYEIEDVIDYFEHRLQKRSRNPVEIIRKLMTRRDVASRIQNINKEINGIFDRFNRYASINEASSSISLSEVMEDPWDSSPINHPVGINESIKELVDWLIRDGRLVGMPRIEDFFRRLFHLKRGRTPKVISLVGMAGIGKTFLAKQVYDNKRVKKYFKFRTWITVPRSCTPDDLLRLIINRFCNKKRMEDYQGIESMGSHQLEDTLRSSSHLKRYLLVLDDVWCVDALNVIKRALPSHRNGSRVLITTTRSSNVRAYDRVHAVNPLQSGDADKLFCECAFSSKHDSIHPNLSDDILKKCEGLPLAIVTIGKLLWKKGTDVEEWEKVYKSLASESECSIDVSRALSRIIYGYSGLPHHLKPCLIYLGIFPEGQLIKRVRLIQLWIAEGFVEENEDVADHYLNELMDYNMIQVAERSYSGRVKSYKVHPLMRKFFILKAKEEDFYIFPTESQAASSSSSTVKIRRLSISGDDMNCSQDLTHVRSFFAFRANKSLEEKFFSKFEYLRVLDLENAPLKDFPKSLAKLKYLRYLSLANTDISLLPKTVMKFRNMQMLNIKGTLISQLPEEILRLKKLRHLLVYRSSAEGTSSFKDKQAVKVPRGIGSLEALQKLSLIQVNGDEGICSELGKLTQLRKLSLGGLRSEDGWKICSSIQQMKNLNSLSVRSRNVNEPLELHPFSSPPPHLQRLHLRGRLEMLPDWIRLLQQLTCLTLGLSNLKCDPFQELDALPGLMELTLLEAYVGTKLDCTESGNGRGFPNLKLLCLDGLEELEIIHLVPGAMPNLEKIIIRRCRKLWMVPLESKYLTMLKEVELYDVSPAFVSRLQNEKQLQHIKLIPHTHS